jgi:hypothetical protein
LRTWPGVGSHCTVSRERLAASIAETISDYRAGEIERPNSAHVQRWVSQFAPRAQISVLLEVDHILRRTYVSASKVDRWLEGHVDNRELHHGSPALFWASSTLLVRQAPGKSQQLLSTRLRDAVGAAHHVPIGSMPNLASRFVYIDDCLFSGRTLVRDLKSWIENEAPAEADLYILLLAHHAYGLEYARRVLGVAAGSAQKKVRVHVMSAREFEDRLAVFGAGEVLRPSVLPDDAVVRAYAAKLARDAYPPWLRYADAMPPSPLFFSPPTRDDLESEFLRVGCALLASCAEPVMRPLGFPVPFTYGFGALVVTHMNCPNNAPLALWWTRSGDAWHALMPRSLEPSRRASPPPLVLVPPEPAEEEGLLWEAEAARALSIELDRLEFDIDNGRVRVPGEDGYLNFIDREHLEGYLMEVYEEAWNAHVPLLDDDADLTPDSASTVEDALEERFAIELFLVGWAPPPRGS